MADALTYAASGWHIFPCKGKIPRTAHGCKDATTDSDTIRGWWQQWPDATVAIATGALSGLFVVDLDTKNADGVEAFNALERQHGDTDAPTAHTPSGGEHRYFRYPDGVTVKNSASKIAPGVDVRGDGGYVIAPPSAGYEWDIGTESESLPDAPGWLLKIIIEAATVTATTADDVAVIFAKGERNDGMARYAGRFRRMGLHDAELIEALQVINVYRCNPPLKDREVVQIAKSVERYNPNTTEVASVEGWGISILDEVPVYVADPFPPHLLKCGGAIEALIDYILSRSMKPQPVLALAAVIPTIGALAGRRYQTEFGSRTNIYTVGVAPSGQGKEMARKRIKEVLHKAGLSNFLGNEDFASDAGLIRAVEIQSSIVFMIDEFGKMLQTINGSRGQSPHLTNIIKCLMQLFSSSDTIWKGKAYADDKKAPIINQPNACLYGTTVPDSFYGGMTRESLDDGFMSRLLIFVGEERPKRTTPGQSPPSDLLLAKIRRVAGSIETGAGNLISENPDPLVVRRNEAAMALHREYEYWSDDQGKNQSMESACWTRSCDHVDRLALIHTVSLGADEISEESQQWAEGVTRWCVARILADAPNMVADTIDEKIMVKISRALSVAGTDGMGRNELLRSVRLKSRVLDEYIETMQQSGMILSVENQTPGRPQRKYYLTKCAH